MQESTAFARKISPNQVRRMTGTQPVKAENDQSTNGFQLSSAIARNMSPNEARRLIITVTPQADY
jgi:hypothetical protein